MKMNNVKIVMSATILSFLLSTASQAKENNQQWGTLINQYNQTIDEKFDAQDNLDAFKNHLTLYPEDALAQLYTGSSYCLIARDAWMPWKKMSAAYTCIDKMEAALINAQQQYPANSPERLNSYLTFGLTSTSLPAFFQQKESGLDSLSKAKDHPNFNYLPENLQQKILNILSSSQL